MSSPRFRFRFRTLWALVFAVALALPAIASAATITGFVKNEAGVGVGNVELNFIDQCTGSNVFLASNLTAADGSFSVSIASGTYDVRFIPPAATGFYASETNNYVVSANASMGIVTVHPGRLVSGTVLTPSLAPAANVDLKWVNLTTGHRTFLTKVLTDVAGHYSLRVPPGTWKVDYRPAAGTTFGDAVRPSLVVGAADISGLSDVLTTGFVVTGSVRKKSGNVKLSNVDVSFYDKCTGATVATSHDNTDINGNFSVVVPAGDYEFTCDPPACDGVESARIGTLLITGPTALGQFSLGGAITVSGTVLAPNGQPMFDAKVKFYDATAAGLPRQGASHDHTDINGHFSILVPAGVYDINILPPAGVNALVYHLAAVATGAGNLNVGTLQTTAGFALSGHVQGPGNAPQLNVNINVLDHVTRVSQRLSEDNSDASGNFTVYVAPGTYDIHYDTPACDGLAAGQKDSVIVTAATVLPTVNLVPGVHVLGSVTDALALPVAGANLDLFPAGSPVKLYTPGAKTAATGAYDVFVPAGSYDFHFLPPVGTRMRPVQSNAVTIPALTTLTTTVLPNGWFVSGTVVDHTSLLPVAGATIEFFPNGLLPVLWLASQTSDAFGAFNSLVNPGTYDIHVTAPAGSPYVDTWMRHVVVGADLPLGNVLMSPPSAGVGPGAGSTLSLAAPAPNPAHGRVNLSFEVPGGESDLSAWDIAGRRVATLWHGKSAGPVTVQWDGTRSRGGALPTGLYMIRLMDAQGRSQLRRVTLLQ